jgi:hypothetical protein
MTATGVVRRDGEAVRLFTRRGYDWTDRYPAIASAAAKFRAKSLTLKGEAVVAGSVGTGRVRVSRCVGHFAVTICAGVVRLQRTPRFRLPKLRTIGVENS